MGATPHHGVTADPSASTAEKREPSANRTVHVTMYPWRARFSLFLLTFACTGTSVQHTSVQHICHWEVPETLPNEAGRILPSRGVFQRFVVSGLQRVQADLCRCLPRRRRHIPETAHIMLHIRPQPGEIKLVYRLEPSASASSQQISTCLGEPTVQVRPSDYVSDMLTGDGSRRETLRYPLRVELRRIQHDPDRDLIAGPRGVR